RSIVTPQTAELFLLCGRQAVLALPPIALRLLHPVADALLGRLELLRQLRRAAPGPNHLHQPSPELRRVRRATLRHRRPLLPKRRGVHETQATSLRSASPRCALRAVAL